MGKGSNTTSTSSSTSADPQAAQAYRDLLTRAQGVASTPYQAYSGDLTADVNSQQNAGIAGINNAAGFANPYIQNASQQATAASAPIDAATLQQYQNPYTQQVIDATTQQLQHDNSQQMAQLQGNQISQGALGGNATGVAKGILAGQQGRTMASTTAGLYQDSYNKAMSAAQSQQQMGLAGANAQANYGISGQAAALQGAGAQIGAGTLQQQTDQANLNALYGQYQQQQAYPYQQTQWLAGLATGVGPGLGSTSQGTTTGPPPNQTAQYLGLGLSAASLLSDRTAKDHISSIGKMNDGTPIYRFKYKGDDQWHVGPMAQDVEKRNPHAVERGLGGLRYVNLEAATDDSVRERASGGGVGGVPWGGAQGWIPELGLKSAAPQHTSGPSLPQQPQQDFSKLASGITGLGGSKLADQFGSYFRPDSYGTALTGGFDGAYGGSSSSPLAGLDASDYGPGFASGGAVDDYTGGDPAWDDPALSLGMGADPGFGDRFGGDGGGNMGVMPRGDALAHYLRQPDAIRATNDYETAGSVNPDDPVRLQGSTFGPDDPGPGPGSALAAGSPVVASDDDDESPVGVAGRAGGAGRPPVMAYDGRQPPLPQRAAEEERSGFGLLPISKNAGAGLLTAGLGMLASRSPFLGNAVGEGGLAGFAAYGNAEEKDRKIAAEADKLAREAEGTNYERWMGDRKQTETERHNRAAEETGSKLPPLYARDKNGNIILAPGAEDATRKLTNARRPEQGEPMSDDAIKLIADRVRAGDAKAVVGFGRGAQGAADLRRVHEQVAKDAAAGKPVDPAARSILQNAAQQAGLLAAERTQAQIMAKLSVYGRTAFNATEIALEMSKAVPRTQWQPVNRIILAAKEKTGDPAVVALGQSLMTLTNEYARAIGGGHGTVHDKEAAERRLSAVQTPEQLEAVIAVMRREILAEEAAMPAARQHIRDIYNPGANGPAGGHSIAGEHGVKPPPGPVSGASGFTPPAGAIPRIYQGKTYYYDPATKQPYPGQ